MPAFVDTIAYAGETPWHRLGTHLGEENVTGAHMQLAAGLGWEVAKVPVFYARDGAMLPVPDQFTLTRDDTRESLGAVVGSKYTPFQNTALFSFLESLRAEGDVRFHTAGSLMGGRKVWALAQVAGELKVKRNGSTDTLAPFILGYSTHDGSACITARLTTIRVVCWNTLSMALREGGQPEFRVRHTVSASERTADAARVLGLMADEVVAEQEVLQGLSDTAMPMHDFALFASQVLTGEDDPDKARQTMRDAEGRSASLYERKGDSLLGLFREGRGNQGTSRYDALNAVTEYVDGIHARPGKWSSMDDETLGKAWNAAMFGMGEATKRRAYALLTA